MLKKKKGIELNKIVLNINKLIQVHDFTFVKLCNKKGEIFSITAIDSIEYKSDESLLHLEKTINDIKETVTAFLEESIKNIDYTSDINKDKDEVLVVTVTV